MVKNKPWIGDTIYLTLLFKQAVISVAVRNKDAIVCAIVSEDLHSEVLASFPCLTGAGLFVYAVVIRSKVVVLYRCFVRLWLQSVGVHSRECPIIQEDFRSMVSALFAQLVLGSVVLRVVHRCRRSAS